MLIQSQLSSTRIQTATPHAGVISNVSGMKKYSNLPEIDRAMSQNHVMRFFIVAIAAILLILLFGTTDANIIHSDANKKVASPQLKINFPVPGSLISFFYSDTNGPDPDIEMYISTPADTEGTTMHFLGRIEPEGGVAQIESVFTQDIDDDGCKELFVLARWEVSHPGLRTFGNLFRTYVYKASIDGASFSRMEQVEQKIGSGMEGISEGKKVHYPYRDAGSIRKLLSKMHKQP